MGLIYLSTSFVGIVNMVSRRHEDCRTLLGPGLLIVLLTECLSVRLVSVCQMSVMPVMAKERAAFYREQASSSYHVIAYAISYGKAHKWWRPRRRCQWAAHNAHLPCMTGGCGAC